MIYIKASDDVVKKRQAIISNIVEIRLEKWLSQTQLAKLTGMHCSNICRIESGRQNISLDTLIRIFDALGKDRAASLDIAKVLLSPKANWSVFLFRKS